MITLVLVSRTWGPGGRRRSLKIKGRYPNRTQAAAAQRKLLSYCYGKEPDYQLLGPRQLRQLEQAIQAEQRARHKAAVRKAVATRKARGEKPHFILCPVCQAKSRKLFSEMGGLQTRRCQHGHHFEVDTFFGFETDKRQVHAVCPIPIKE